MNILNLPINTAATVVAAGVLGVAAYVVKTKSRDTHHIVDAHTEALKIGAEQQATMLATMKEMTSKTLV
jgi:hypothetical protein